MVSHLDGWLMIYWLTQTLSAHPDLARAVMPPGLLSVSEQRRCETFTVEKRRRDWLLGRWTAKHLAQAVLGSCAESDLNEIEIATNPNGAPYLADYRDWSLSISHSADRAFCALSDIGSIGVDIERIEARQVAFVEDFFTPAEQIRLTDLPERQRHVAITVIWSAKESGLKTLQCGLTVDSRTMDCRFTWTEDQWKPLEITVDTQRIAEAPNRLYGWWKADATFVYTLAATKQAHPVEVTIPPIMNDGQN